MTDNRRRILFSSPETAAAFNRAIGIKSPRDYVAENFTLSLAGNQAGQVFVVDAWGARPANESELRIAEKLLPYLRRPNVKAALARMRESAPNVDNRDGAEVLMAYMVDQRGRR